MSGETNATQVYFWVSSSADFFDELNDGSDPFDDPSPVEVPHA
jgi:hypothetical protein